MSYKLEVTMFIHKDRRVCIFLLSIPGTTKKLHTFTVLVLLFSIILLGACRDCLGRAWFHTHDKRVEIEYSICSKDSNRLEATTRGHSLLDPSLVWSHSGHRRGQSV